MAAVQKRKVSRLQVSSAIVGFLFGIVWLLLVRAILAYPRPVHYHANFAVYVNGHREQFEGFGYYEEVQACSEDYLKNPLSRVHMHQPANDVVHVHGTPSTWGNFFENLGLALGDKVVETSQGLFVDGQGGELSYILNGQPASSVAGRVIGSEDRLLISFGDPADAPGQFEQVATSAADFNTTPDPASCSGQTAPSFGQRLRHALFE